MTQAADVEATAKPSPATGSSRDQFDFFELPRPIQDRLLASVSGSGAPRVILFQPASVVSGLSSIAVFVASASVVLALAVAGYGSLKSPFALQAVMLTPIYGAFGGLAAIALAAYAWARSAQGRYPYRFGSYLFPSGVLVIKDDQLRWHRLDALEAFQPVGTNRVRLRFPGTAFVFPLPQGLTGVQVERTLEDFRERLRVAYEQKDRRALAALDPLRDSGFSNPLSSHNSIPRPRDQRPWRYALALILGATIAVMIFFARNKLGERTIYQRALSANTIHSYQDYLARGGLRPEVSEILLPRAQLEKIKTDTALVEEFSLAYPDSKIRGEIDLALRAALLRELEKVREAGTLEALAAFAKQHPQQALIEQEVALARRAVFDSAYAEFKKNSDASDLVRRLFRQMVTASETAGPEVEVRFLRKEPVSARSADSAIRRSAYYGGAASLPSQYFTAEAAKPREDAAAAKLAAALQESFPSEVLKFMPGESASGDEELPKTTRPTLFMTYKTEMSGGYTTNRPRNVYVGIGFMIEAELIVPKVEDTYQIKYSKWLPPDINEISRDGLKPGQVYDANIRSALELFHEKLLADLLPPKPGG
jgi:hypothetical protein